MSYLLIRHKVDDYDAWKENFDSEESDRRAQNSEGGWIFRSKQDPDEVIVLSEWESVDDAREYAKSSANPETLKKAGIEGEIEVLAMREVASFDA